ncbi:hypothetical protein VTO73DRAFT_2108 [Trametes versicolor]
MKSPTVSSPVPKKAKKYPRSRPKPGHIPRPPNSFILWRAAFCKDQTDKVTGKHIPQSIISKSAGPIWASLPAAQKNFWVNEAKKAKLAHMAQYPEYKFQPTLRNKRREEKDTVQNAAPSTPSITADRQQKPSGNEARTTASTTNHSRPSGSRISRVVAQINSEDQNAPPTLQNHPTRTIEGAGLAPPIARSTAFRQPSLLPTSPHSQQNPPRLSRPLRATQPTADPAYDTYSRSSYPIIPNLLPQGTYHYSGTSSASATQTAPPSGIHSSSSLWPPPLEPFDSNLVTAQDYDAACDIGEFYPQAGDQETLPALSHPPLPPPPQPLETYQMLYYEPPVPDQWQYVAPPVEHENEWIRPELYQAVPWDPYVDTGEDEEEWAEARSGNTPLSIQRPGFHYHSTSGIQHTNPPMNSGCGLFWSFGR